MTRFSFRMAAAALLVLEAGLALGQPSALTYQGQLRDSGQPVTGTVNLEFRLFDQLSGGSEVATVQSRPNWPVEDGLFQVDIDFGSSAFNGAERYLEVRVNGAPLLPRQRVTATPYALLAGGLVGGVPETGWSLTGNAGTGPGNFLGTTDNQPLVFRVGGERAMQLGGNSSQSPNILAGSFFNSIAAGVNGATISGGGGSIGPCGTSCRNSVTANFGTVSGGHTNTASGSRSTIGGGAENSASDPYSTVGGGFFNVASGRTSTIAGGRVNTASGEDSAILGGRENAASGFLSTVAGGLSNCAGGAYSLAGGRRAKVRFGTTSTAERGCSGIPGSGDSDGDNGTFVWADSQNADFTSTGANQFLVRADGGFGFNTNAIPNGIEAVFQSRGGININTDLYLRTAAHGRGINLAMLPTAGAAEFRIAQFDGTTFVDRLFLFANGDFQVTAQAFKPGGGSWAASSDRRLKSEIEPLTGALDRMLSLAGVTFEYTDPDPARRPAGQHMGFIAQDVAEVFPDWVETDRDGYLTVGSRGFEALTVEAMRELRVENQFAVARLAEENAELRAHNAVLEARLARLETLLNGTHESTNAR